MEAKHDKLLAELDLHSNRPECHGADAAIRSLRAEFFQRKAQEEAEQENKTYSDRLAFWWNASKEWDKLEMSLKQRADAAERKLVELEAERKAREEAERRAHYEATWHNNLATKLEAAECKLAEVEKKTIERCAKVCDRRGAGNTDADEEAKICAEEIRALAQKGEK